MTPKELLDIEYAKGNIGRDEYVERKAKLPSYPDGPWVREFRNNAGQVSYQPCWKHMGEFYARSMDGPLPPEWKRLATVPFPYEPNLFRNRDRALRRASNRGYDPDDYVMRPTSQF